MTSIKAADASGVRRKKCRIVICGNFEPANGMNVYTANADIGTVRLVIILAARHRWKLSTMDVSTAFLNADLPVESGRVLVRPPKILVSMGLIRDKVLWELRKAQYGLRVSPRAWGIERDSGLRRLRFQCGADRLALVQSYADSSLWTVVKDAEEIHMHHRVALGYLVTYVDDFLIASSEQVTLDLMAAVESLWACTRGATIEAGSDGSLEYLGITIQTGAFQGFLYTRPLMQKRSWRSGA